ncbi:sugar ABC transporter permease [Clostridium sediminicola]|uniref:carbohydrate ABC transporter permease n=1 Tax=Clostridium sediminicola TaxID=3114879 RepID=UPI0031F2762D
MHRQRLIKVLFLLPFMIPLLLFWILPLITGFGISLTDWDYISPQINIVGFENYMDIFTDPDFIRALVNTFIFGIGTIVATIVLGLLFALMLQKEFTGSKIYQMIIFSPWITPTVAVALVWSWIYEPDRGFANFILGFFGVQPLEWLHSSETAMLGVIIFTIWKSIGWTMLFYLGALERVPQSIYESATLDGCNYLRKFYHITLPLISPTTYFLIIVNLISSIQVYDQIQIMTQGGPGGSTTTLLYLYYEKAFQNFQMGPANAVAMVILVIIVMLSILSSYISRKFVHYE